MKITFESFIEQLFTKDSPNQQVRDVLKRLHFQDEDAAFRILFNTFSPKQAHRNWMLFLDNLLSAIEDSADPDRSLLNIDQLLNNAKEHNKLVKEFAENPRLVEVVVTLFSGSQFLSDILISAPDYLTTLTKRDNLAQIKTVEIFYTGIQNSIFGKSYEEKINVFRKFQQQELLRIGLADLLSVVHFGVVVRQLSSLADALIQSSLDAVRSEFSDTPLDIAVLSMGKLGGRELNYSSDIDLIFLAEQTSEKHQQAGQRIIDILSRMTANGFLYRVDMRLRPWGNAGRLVPSRSEYDKYLAQHAKDWEKQALLKARPVAGNIGLGLAFLNDARPFIFARSSPSTDNSALQKQVHGMKQKIESKLKKTGKTDGEVKNGIGSIRDIAFTTQYLQLRYGEKYPEILSRNTLNALARMSSSGIIPLQTAQILNDGYLFLRSIEHFLQIMHNQQTHQLPTSERELNRLAKRLGFTGDSAGNLLMKRYYQHREAIRDIYRRYLGVSFARQISDKSENTADEPKPDDRFIALDNAYQKTFSKTERLKHAQMNNQLNENLQVLADIVETNENRWKVSIVGYDYLGALSLICGLISVHHCSIIDGEIYTLSVKSDTPTPNPWKKKRMSISERRRLAPKKMLPKQRIIDVFIVENKDVEKAVNWESFQTTLQNIWIELSQNNLTNARLLLARKFSSILKKTTSTAQKLLPVDVEIDNTSNSVFTILRIDTQDTQGFLYELTNALSLNRLNIARVVIRSVGNRAHDTIYVTDENGEKIASAEKQRQLRLTTVLVKHFTHLLPHSSHPVSSMTHFQELIGQIFSQKKSYAELASLEQPEVLSALVKMLGVSEFLWEDFLRMQHQNLFPIFQNLDILDIVKSKSDLKFELIEKLKNVNSQIDKKRILNEFKDREMFRIDMRYILEKVTVFWQFTKELSDLAEVVLNTAFEIVLESQQQQFGIPHDENGEPAKLCLCALGKFGGQEMGFASDLELMLIYDGEGITDGQRTLSNIDFFDRLLPALDDMIIAKSHGIFELDLRIRPYGSAGRLAVSLHSFNTYFSKNGPAWNYERQALVRMRSIWGDRNFQKTVTELRDQLIYKDAAFDADAMHAIREKQVLQLVEGGSINAKFSPGGLVDIEYLIQGLQILNGKKHPNLRRTNTQAAIKELVKSEILTSENAAKLVDAHLFIRRIIEALRMVRGNAKDLTLPEIDSEDFSFLAYKLGYDEAANLHKDLFDHLKYSSRNFKNDL